LAANVRGFVHCRRDIPDVRRDLLLTVREGGIAEAETFRITAQGGRHRRGGKRR